MHNLKLEISEFDGKVKIRPIIADVRDFEVMTGVFEKYKPDFVYHAAAYKHVPLMEENPGQAIYTNVIGTKNLADLSQQFKVENLF